MKRERVEITLPEDLNEEERAEVIEFFREATKIEEAKPAFERSLIPEELDHTSAEVDKGHPTSSRTLTEKLTASDIEPDDPGHGSRTKGASCLRMGRHTRIRKVSR